MRAPVLAFTALLLGTLVNGGCYDDGHPQVGVCTFDGAVAVPDEGWQHVPDEAELVYKNNPPA